MALRRLTRERYRRMQAAGEFPQMPIEPVSAIATPDPAKRGGRPTHPSWFRVMAIVRTPSGLMHDFVTETPTLQAAIVEASRYPYRAIVTSAGSKREFDNWKSFEVA